MRVPVYDIHGKRTQDILEFDEHIFGDEVRTKVLKEAILMYEARQRVGTHQTKTRGQVAGSGRKLWKQKHTGRARVGPARAPHWPGGGRVFGPHPRDYSYAMPRKARMVALDSAWLAKVQDKELLIMEGFNVANTPKTKEAVAALENMGIYTQRTLIALPQHNELLWKSLRNIPRVTVEALSHLNPYLLLVNKHIVIMRQAFEELIKSRGGEVKILNRQEVYKEAAKK
jgi:large subunit ribosomal protein L4